MTNNNLVSVIIPSYVDEFLQNTVDDLLSKAEGNVEVIVVLGGYWPTTALKADDRVTIIHYGTPERLTTGMRESINRGIDIARGEYIMKLDEHCVMDQGYDLKLKADCDDNWVVIPRRYRLDAPNWKVIEDGRPPIDYMFLDFPFENGKAFRGLQGVEWRERYHQRIDIPIDDTMSWQGSCWFMKRKYWDKIGPLDSELYGTFVHEAQEIGNKVWLGGGRLVVNKKTWYAHYHKNRSSGGMTREQYSRFSLAKDRGRKECIDYWFGNKWPGRIHNFDWLIDKFWPVPHWPDNWKEQII